MTQPARLNRWAGVVLLLAVAILYRLTLDNGLRPDELTGGDLITHQYAQVEARPSNAPGYPLYTMGGWLWFRLGGWLLGWALNPIEILSAYSTLWGLAALAILYLILLRVSGGRWWVAGLLTGFQATTFFFWYYSVTTEQYTSAVFQTVLAIWLAFNWDDDPRDSRLLWLALLSGTMLANMVTTLFILPPLLGFIATKKIKDRPAWRRYLSRPQLILKAVGLALLPLLSYAYVYIRGAQHPEWRGAGEWPTAWAWFIQFLTIQQGRDELAPGLTLDPFFTAEFPGLMIQELTWPLFFSGLLGLAALGRRRAIFLYLTLVIYLIFCWGYRFGNWFQVIIPAYPIFVIGVGAGLRWMVEAALPALSWRPPARRAAALLVGLLLGGLLLYRLSASWPQANQRNHPAATGLEPGWALLADRPAPPALVAVDFAEWVALQYLRSVWGLAPGLIPVQAGQPPPDQLAQEVNRYVSRRGAGAAPGLIRPEVDHPQAAGAQLIALPPGPVGRLPASARPVDLAFGPALRLAGWAPVEPDETRPPVIARRRPDPAWRLALYWQTSAPLPADYTVSVRPLVDGQLLWVGDEPLIQDHPPVWGFYPTSQWRPGELVRDLYVLPLPAGVTPEAVQIVVYRTTADGFENLAEQTLSLASN